MRNLRFKPCGVAMAVVLVALSVPAWGAGAGTPDVQQQIQQLTKAVQDLAGKVNVLEREIEGIRRGPGQPAAAATGGASAPSAAAQVTSGGAAASTPAAAPPKQPLAAAATAATQETPRDAAAKAWHKIEGGMQDSAVVAMLGPPQRKFKLGGQTVWYYYYPDVGSGTIFFFDDGRVASSQSPPFHFWSW